MDIKLNLGATLFKIIVLHNPKIYISDYLTRELLNHLYDNLELPLNSNLQMQLTSVMRDELYTIKYNLRII